MSQQSQRELAKRRARSKAANAKKEKPESVLLNAQDLTNAARIATNGGRTKMTGLYLPTGQRIEAHEDDKLVQNNAKVHNAAAQRNLNLSKVARAYHANIDQQIRIAKQAGKTPEEMEDERSRRKAKKILAESNEHEVMLYKDLFAFFDVDKDRTWGSIEFAQQMTDVGYGTSVEDASNLLYFAGVRDVDRITYEDFLQMMPKLKAFRKMIEKDIMRNFQKMDNGSGWITRKQLRTLLQNIAGPEGIDKEKLEMMVKKADREKINRISFEFLIMSLFNGKPIVPYQKPSRTGSWLARIFGCGTSSLDPIWDDSPDGEEEKYQDRQIAK